MVAIPRTSPTTIRSIQRTSRQIFTIQNPHQMNRLIWGETGSLLSVSMKNPTARRINELIPIVLPMAWATVT